jgi:DNA transformation protein
MRSDFRCFLLLGVLSDLARSPDTADVTATISEIHGAVDVENLLHDSLPLFAPAAAARPDLNQADRTMVASETYAEFLREQLAPLGRVTMRGMFGKTGVFCDGVMLGVVTENTLYFRVDDENREAFREAEAFPPLNYAKKGQIIDLAFWRVPERLFDEPDELIAWARAALAAAHRVAAKRPAPKQPKASKQRQRS